MAQPPATPTNPDVNETFLREVDENLRRDRISDFFRDNKKALIVALVLFLGASAGLIWYEQYRKDQAGAQVEDLTEAYRAISKNEPAAANAKLAAAAGSSSQAVKASAEFTQAALALEKGDTATASKIYGEIHADSAMPEPYREAALIRQTALDFDKLKPDEVIARLAPLAKVGGPWYASAAEMTGAALLKQGKKAEAGKLFAQVANDKTAPDSLRARSVQIAGSLGVDASAAMIPGQ